MNTISMAIAASLALTGAIALPAAAAQAGQAMPSVEVSFADLNLASDEGVAVLDRRLDSAIEKVCGGPIPMNLSSAAPIKRCIKATRELADTQRDLAVRSERGSQLAFKGQVIRLAGQ